MGFQGEFHKAVGPGGFIDGHHDFLGLDAEVSVLVMPGKFAGHPAGKRVHFASTGLAERVADKGEFLDLAIGSMHPKPNRIVGMLVWIGA